jgi:hypothetical protein
VFRYDIISCKYLEGLELFNLCKHINTYKDDKKRLEDKFSMIQAKSGLISNSIVLIIKRLKAVSKV